MHDMTCVGPVIQKGLFPKWKMSSNEYSWEKRFVGRLLKCNADLHRKFASLPNIIILVTVLCKSSPLKAWVKFVRLLEDWLRAETIPATPCHMSWLDSPGPAGIFKNEHPNAVLPAIYKNSVQTPWKDWWTHSYKRRRDLVEVEALNAVHSGYPPVRGLTTLGTSSGSDSVYLRHIDRKYTLLNTA